jgi:hypothetical protein
MICLRTLLRIYGKKSNPKKLKIKSFLAAQSYLHDKKIGFWGITVSLENGIL